MGCGCASTYDEVNPDSTLFRQIQYQIPAFLQRLYGGVVWRGGGAEKSIYLTFDDGCIPQVTPQVLDILDEYGIKATFFCVGDNIRKYPELFVELLRRGHAVGNHTYNHLEGLRTPTDTYYENIDKTDELIDRYHPQGKHRMHLFRPPYGRMTLRQKRRLQQTHTIVLWDLITHDYDRTRTPAEIMTAIRRYSRSGSIVLFHDSLKAADNMLAVLPQAIRYWQKQGYHIKPITTNILSDNA